jgi:excinuclease ABC subunit B
VVKRIKDLIDGVYSDKAGKEAEQLARTAQQVEALADMSEKDLAREIKRLEKQMFEHARNLEFEQAARVRDQLAQLKQHVLGARG